MGMRVTQSSSNRNYLKNLNYSQRAMNLSMEKVETGRNFKRVSQDIKSASKAIDVRTRIYKNEMTQNNVSIAIEDFDLAENTVVKIGEVASNVYSEMLRAMNGENYKNEKDIFKTFLEESKSEILRLVNQKSNNNNKYIMGGLGTEEEPFVPDENGNLKFNGAEISALKYKGQILNYLDSLDDETSVDPEFDQFDVDLNDEGEVFRLRKEISNSEENYFIDGKPVKNSGDSFIDVGLDISTDNIRTTAKTAFSTSVDGVSILGYGMSRVVSESSADIDDEDEQDGGISNNIYDMMTAMQAALEYEDLDKMDMLMTNFKKQMDNIISARSDIGIKTDYLETTLSRLENENKILCQTQNDLEKPDEATEITGFMGYRNAWNLTMQFGSSIVPKSLLDYVM